MSIYISLSLYICIYIYECEYVSLSLHIYIYIYIYTPSYQQPTFQDFGNERNDLHVSSKMQTMQLTNQCFLFANS